MTVEVCTSPYPNLGSPRVTPIVYIVDDDVSVRDSLAPLVRAAGWQPMSLSSLEEFLVRRGSKTSPGCLLAELHLPGSTDLELRGLNIERTGIPVILMSDHIELPIAVQAMKGGAFEVLTKPVVPNMLLRAIKSAIERSRAALIYLAHVQALQERYALLSAREIDVMRLVVAGRLNKLVGNELGITEATVKVHRGRIMRKMEAGSFAELVTMASSLRHAVEPGGRLAQAFNQSRLEVDPQ